MTYDYRSKRAVVLLSQDLTPGQALNAVAHLCISLGRYGGDDLMGRPFLVDASGQHHAGIAKYAIIVKTAKTAQIRQAVEIGRRDDALHLADFPQEMFETGHDDELAESILRKNEPTLEYRAALFYGPTANVDAICKKFSLWK